MCLLSTFENVSNVSNIERKERNGETINLACPQGIIDYNKSMGFVDRFDHLKCLYEIDRKSYKWWHRLFFHFLDVSVVNAYILYNMLPDKCSDFKTMKDFRCEVIMLKKMYKVILNTSRNNCVAENPKSIVEKKQRIISYLYLNVRC